MCEMCRYMGITTKSDYDNMHKLDRFLGEEFFNEGVSKEDITKYILATAGMIMGKGGTMSPENAVETMRRGYIAGQYLALQEQAQEQAQAQDPDDPHFTPSTKYPLQ